jgi:hypothetical protein
VDSKKLSVDLKTFNNRNIKGEIESILTAYIVPTYAQNRTTLDIGDFAEDRFSLDDKDKAVRDSVEITPVEGMNGRLLVLVDGTCFKTQSDVKKKKKRQQTKKLRDTHGHFVVPHIRSPT